LADPDAKVLQIAKLHHVSEHTVRAIREREAVAIAERKQRLMSIFANVAEVSAERMEELAGQASLRDAGITAGIATDKLLALSGDSALTQTQQNLHLHLQSNDIARQFNELLDTLVKGDDVNGALNGHAVKSASASEPKPIRVIEESPVIPNINSSPEASAREESPHKKGTNFSRSISTV
jgi:hypothetical protein